MSTTKNTAAAYDAYANRYQEYADGLGFHDFLGRQFAISDYKLYLMICDLIQEYHREYPERTVRVIDCGCGPGTWLIRLHHFCSEKQITFEGLGLDISSEMIKFAQENLNRYTKESQHKSVPLNFLIADITEGLGFEENAFTFSICLYTVLNHIPNDTVDYVISEMMRVSHFCNITTTRGSKGQPTAFVGSLSSFGGYFLDNKNKVLKLTSQTGEEIQVTCNLIELKNLRESFEKYGKVREILGLDVIKSRFTSNPNWDIGEDILEEVVALEEKLCRDFQWIDRANHVLIVCEKI